MTTGRSKFGERAVTLEPVSWDAHGSLLATWLRRPHVSRWWNETDNWPHRIRETPEPSHAIIAASGMPVGYIRWQNADREVLDELGLSDIPEQGVDIDLFLGEPDWLGRGVGPEALRLLLARLGRNHVPLAGLCPSVQNIVAIRAFEKVGFRKLRQFDDPTAGLCWVMLAEPSAA